MITTFKYLDVFVCLQPQINVEHIFVVRLHWRFFQIEFVVLHFHGIFFSHYNHYVWKSDFMTLTWFPMTCAFIFGLSINLNWMAIVKFKFQFSFLFFGPFQFWCELFYFYLDWANSFINLRLVIFVYPRGRKYGNPNQNKNGQSVNHSADVCQQIHCWKMKYEKFKYNSQY